MNGLSGYRERLRRGEAIAGDDWCYDSLLGSDPTIHYPIFARFPLPPSLYLVKQEARVLHLVLLPHVNPSRVSLGI